MVRRLAVSLVALALLGWACSSTGKDDGEASGVESEGSVTTSTVSPGDADAGSSVSAAPGSPSGSSKRTATAPAAGTGRAGPTAVASVGGAAGALLLPEAGRGFDKTTITIGVDLIKDLAEGAAAIGGKGADTGDTKAQAQSVINYVNDNGGLAGRRVVPVYHLTDQARNWDAEADASCADYTQDHKVFAVLGALLSTSQNLAYCLADRKTPLVINGRTVLDDRDLEKLSPYAYLPGRMSATRWASFTVDSLANQGYFSAGYKLALVRFDIPAHERAANQSLKPRVTARDITLSDERVISQPGGLQDFGSASAQISNAILRMRTENVTHVMMMDNHGVLGFLFTPQAESQGWRPRYGFNSVNQGTTHEQNSPDAQMRNLVMVGWLPTDDVTTERDPGGNATKALCYEIFRKAGIAYPARVAYASALGYCDGLLFLKAAFERAPELSAAGLRAGVEALGTAYLSPVGFATRFGPGRYDGAASARPMVYDTSCECFRYSGPVIPVP